MTSGRTVGFRLGTYDRRKPLVIDPVLVFSTFLGGSVADVANAITTDAAGNLYVAGGALSPDFPVTPGVLQSMQKGSSGFGSAFVSKLNPSGTALIFSTYVGGTGGDAAYGLAVDSSGDAYIVGQTASKDFPVTAGAFQTTIPGSRTSFVAKLNPAGNGLAYATYLGGNSAISYLCCDAAAAVAIDSAGNAYVAGTTYATGFPVTQGAVQTKIGSSLASNAYVAKLNPSGSSLVYSTFLGGAGQVQFNIGPAVFEGDVATALAVDRAGKCLRHRIRAFGRLSGNCGRIPNQEQSRDHCGRRQFDPRLQRLRRKNQSLRLCPGLFHLPGRERRFDSQRVLGQ